MCVHIFKMPRLSHLPEMCIYACAARRSIKKVPGFSGFEVKAILILCYSLNVSILPWCSVLQFTPWALGLGLSIALNSSIALNLSIALRFVTNDNPK